MNAAEVNKICKAFPQIKFNEIERFLRKYSSKSPGERIRSTVRDILEFLEEEDSPEQLIADASIIGEIFPEVPYNQIFVNLSLLGSEYNRKRIVIKDIVADDDKKIFNQNIENGKTQPILIKPDPIKRKCDVNNSIKIKRRKPIDDINCDGVPIRIENDYDSSLKSPGLFKYFQDESFLKQNQNDVPLHTLPQNRSSTKDRKSLPCTVTSGEQNTLENPTDSNIVGDVIQTPISSSSPTNRTISLEATDSGTVKPVDKMIFENLIFDPVCKKVEITDCDGKDNQPFTPNPDDGVDLNLLYRVMEIFPEADPQFLRVHCKNRICIPEHIDLIIDNIFSLPSYPKRSISVDEDEAVDPNVQLEILKQVLPDADPAYLSNALMSIATQDELKIFISKAIENQNYPTYKDYLRNQTLSAQVKQYTTEFCVEKFVDLIPDPEIFFNSSERKSVVVKRNNLNYYKMLTFLKNTYTHLSVSHIKNTFDKSQNIILACKELDETKSGLLRTIRKTKYSLEGITDIPLLQVFAYIGHKKDILNYIENKKMKEQKEREAAKEAGLTKTCGCCYEDELMPSEIVNCPNICTFCKQCLEKSVEIAFSEGKLEYPCLLNCGSQFSIQMLQRALKPKFFSKLAQKKVLEEVKAAGIEDLECCPFCDFATIPPTTEKIFTCLNPDCMKETCRACKETSHIPLRCDEIEKDSDIVKRTYVENKMTEALIRKCWKCGLKFIKADGCNKMTCSCGAQMCYVCNERVFDYKHFNGQGGDQIHLCPLYSDTNLLHKEAVLQSAATAKAEMGNNLKVDPTLNVQEYYDKVMAKVPSKVPPGMPR